METALQMEVTTQEANAQTTKIFLPSLWRTSVTTRVLFFRMCKNSLEICKLKQIFFNVAK